MAGKWRIRHKLIFGLGMVVAVLALLLAGTLKGLSSYRSTMRTIDSKLVELTEADNLRGAIKYLAEPNSNPRMQAMELHNRIRQAKELLAKYREKLEENVKAGRDTDKGFQEWQQVKALEQGFARLEKELQHAGGPHIYNGLGQAQPDLLADGSKVRKTIETLVHTSGDLNNVIYNDLYRRIQLSRRDYNISLGIVLTTTVLGVLLMAGLLRFFYRWVFYPIRDLEQGVSRVAQGDFEHRIKVNSGDEIEDLAKAYNDMTTRLREMYRDLATQVNERSRQLVRSERLAGVGFLAAGVAHEINNPLASIAFCAEALERRLSEVFAKRKAGPGETDGQEREIVNKYLKMIQEEAFRCKEITQRLLAFSRGGERRREPTDLCDLIQGVLDMVQHLQNCKGKELYFKPGERIIAWVNGQEIKSVVLNLVVNALDSMEEGGKLTVHLGQKDGLAEMFFQDTGCGMTQEVLENIFEPFFTRSRTGKGTGLGLSISHRIINNHGGDIEAQSDGPNQGSTFFVRLPMQPTADQKENAQDSDNQDPETEFVKLSSGRKAELSQAA